ncbi:MAG: hypothetical protein IPH35_04630 [Rhodoferax sp.]|nr:hypothetical protein [Rhodoferax sp.]
MGFEENVGGKLGLIGAKPVACETCLGQIIYQWIDHAYFWNQRAWPVDVIELLTQFCGSLQVSTPHNLVVTALKINTLLGELATSTRDH